MNTVENNDGVKKLICEQDFSEFCKVAWNIIEPNEYVHSYYDTSYIDSHV